MCRLKKRESQSDHLHTRCNIVNVLFTPSLIGGRHSMSRCLNKVPVLQGQRDMDLIACSVEFAFDPTLIALTL